MLYRITNCNESRKQIAGLTVIFLLKLLLCCRPQHVATNQKIISTTQTGESLYRRPALLNTLHDVFQVLQRPGSLASCTALLRLRFMIKNPYLLWGPICMVFVNSTCPVLSPMCRNHVVSALEVVELTWCKYTWCGPHCCCSWLLSTPWAALWMWLFETGCGLTAAGASRSFCGSPPKTSFSEKLHFMLNSVRTRSDKYNWQPNDYT